MTSEIDYEFKVEVRC